MLKKHLPDTKAADSPTRDAKVCGLRGGAFKLVTFPGEVTVQVGLNIKKAAQDANAHVSGYTNGYIWYTATEQQRRNTGYAQEDCDVLVAPEWQVASAEHHAAEAARVGGDRRVAGGNLADGNFDLGRLGQFRNGDVGLARQVVGPGFVAHQDFQQFVHGGGPVLCGHGQLCLAKARLEVAPACRNLGVQFGTSPCHVWIVCCKFNSAEPALQRLEAPHQPDLGQSRGKGGTRGIVLAQLQQQLDVVKAGGLVLGRQQRRLFQVVQAGLRVVGTGFVADLYRGVPGLPYICVALVIFW